MSYAPLTISALAAAWVKFGGANGGIVGDKNHTGGYHLGKDRIFSSTGKGWNDYSVQYQRDKAGLTNASAGFDLSWPTSNKTTLQHFSRWLVERCKTDARYRKLFREIIYSPNGQLPIHRYSGVDNKVYTGPGSGDNTHLWHTHVSFWRDTESLAKAWIIDEYKKAIQPPDTGTDMGVKVYLPATKDANIYDDFGTAKLNSGRLTRVSDGVAVPLAAGTNLGVVQKATVDGKAHVCLNHAGESHVVPMANVTYTPLTVPPLDCDAEVKAAVDKANAECATKVAAASADGYKKGTADEKSRLRKFLGL